MYDGGASGSIIYGYVSGNPLSFIDPNGLEKCKLSAEDMRKMGDAPAGMNRPHRHHIVMEKAPSNWKDPVARQNILDSQDILSRNGIDLNTDLRNFTWAENKGHTKEYAGKVFERLSQGQQNAGSAGVEQALRSIGNILRGGGSL